MSMFAEEEIEEISEALFEAADLEGCENGDSWIALSKAWARRDCLSESFVECLAEEIKVRYKFMKEEFELEDGYLVRKD